MRGDLSNLIWLPHCLRPLSGGKESLPRSLAPRNPDSEVRSKEKGEKSWGAEHYANKWSRPEGVQEHIAGLLLIAT